MLVREDLENGYVKIYSDDKKKIIRNTDKAAFSSAIQPSNSSVNYTEKQ